jgi:hypothetical protein
MKAKSFSEKWRAAINESIRRGPSPQRQLTWCHCMGSGGLRRGVNVKRSITKFILNVMTEHTEP